MLPVALTSPPVNTLPPVMLAPLVMVPVAVINPPVNKLPPVMLAPLVMVLVALINPPVSILPPVTLPDPLIVPVMPNPVVARVNTLVVPLTLPTMFPLVAGMLISLVPFCTLLAAPTLPDATTPVSPAPLPVKNAAVILPVALT